MGAYKQFNAQDLIVSPLELNKTFYFQGGDELIIPEVGIDRYLGRNGSYLLSGIQTTGNIIGQELPVVLVYDSIQQLYYGNYKSGSGGFSQEAITSSLLLGANRSSDVAFGGVENSNYYDYPSTTLWPSREFPIPTPNTASVPVGVLSIPSKLFGDYIQPNSFLLEGPTGSIKDDGNGRLLFKTTSSGAAYNYMAGNIIYEHGIITLFDSHLSGAINTDGGSVDQDFYGTAIYGTSVYGGTAIVYPGTLDFINAWIDSNNVTMSFSSSYTVYETQYKATLNNNEFNYSLNPSIITGSGIPTYFPPTSINWENTASLGIPLGFATSSYFSPYITTVGLYDENYNLLAVGKLAKPLQSSPTTDTTILINIDR